MYAQGDIKEPTRLHDDPLFLIIIDFKNNPKIDFYHLYNLPNIIRRYLEAFLGFKVPKHQGLDKKLDYLIDDKVTKERILKFIHHYSHNNSLPRSLNFPDLKECCEVVGVVIETIKQKDVAHFEALIESIPNAP
ncbi:MAG: AAA family ATPase [Planctomycetia bacterium]|nr:MAG: AAA family ATPase [Planctomycetia bacterium]